MSFDSNEAFNAAAPYHQTFLKANELLNDLKAQLGGGSISKVARYNSDSTLTEWYPFQPPSNNFDLVLGVGVLIVSGDGGWGYVWPHY